MPTPNELARRVQKYVKDLSYDNDIPDLLNEAIIAVDKSEDPLILRPELETSDTVDTVAFDEDDPVNYVDLPDDYGKHLFAVESSNQNSGISSYVSVTKRYSSQDFKNSKPEINILDNMRFMYQKWSRLDLSGPVEDVVPINGKLYYARIPTDSDTLTLHYYKSATQITRGDNTEITEFPAQLQYDLFSSYAAARIFEMKNLVRQIKLHMTLHSEALVKLARLNKHSSRQETWKRGKVGMI